MIKFYTLFSSSSGNSSLLSTGETNILIDAGVSASKICASLKDVGILPNELDGILITHEHRDHILGAGALARKYNIPLYSNCKTLLETVKITGDVYEHNLREVEAKKFFDIRQFSICPFSISHDGVSPMGYSIFYDNKKYTVATDVGCITESLLKSVCKSDAVLLESNHDIKMLNNGKYPYYLKKRILGDYGHLSNDKASWLSTQLAKWGTKNIILGHLSKENNTYDIAYNTTYNMLKDNGIEVGKDVNLKIALPNQTVEII
jgi:phosphoribosyl 1,2-cyclic phosphodiesterase